MSIAPDIWRKELARCAREADPVGERATGYSLGAVAFIVVPRADKLHFLATERQAHLPYHGGQISLPGGGVREGEESPEQAARREVEEELGLPGDRLKMLGTLGHFPIPVTQWDVLAYLTWWDGHETLSRQVSEVKTILEVPLSPILEQHRECTEIAVAWGPGPTAPLPMPEFLHHQDGRAHRIWGCTGRIVHHFLDTVYLPARRAILD